MNNWSLLRVMILKEIRATFRERSQMRGLVLGGAIIFLVFGSMVYSGGRSHHHQSTTASAAASAKVAELAVLRPEALWLAIGVATAVGFFFSMGYLISAVLASFVGEKEGRTLEILLVSPLSDGKLFGIKCISTLLPSAAIGFLLAVVIAILASIFAQREFAGLPPAILLLAVLLSLPFLILLQLWVVGLGAAISVRAETMKGANQTLGIAIMVLIFGVAYGVPFLLTLFPSQRLPLMHLGMAWLKLHYLAQYGSLLLILGIPAVLLIGVGRACFRRDRMLT